MALPKLNRTDELENLYGTVLVYGPAGAGKTRATKTLVTHGFNPIVIACELGNTAGLLSLKSSKIPFVQVGTQKETVEVIQAMKRVPGKVTYDGQEFGAVVLDSITQWGEFPLEDFVKMKKWIDLATPEESKDPRMAYGYLSEKGRQIYKALFELSGHLIIIAREGTFGDGTPAHPYFQAPELPGQKLPRELPGWPDATVRLRVINGAHRMVTKGAGSTPARVRLPEDFPLLPEYCLPDIGGLLKFMCGDKTAIKFLLPDPKAEAAAKLAAKAAAAAEAGGTAASA